MKRILCALLSALLLLAAGFAMRRLWFRQIP